MTNTYDNSSKSFWYNLYIKYGNEKANEAKAIKQDTNFSEFIPKRNLIQVADVGSGNGLLSKKIISLFLQNFPQTTISYTAFDTSKDLAEIFFSNCSEVCSKNLRLNFRACDFFENKDNNKYDFLIAAHSMYRNDLGYSVRKIINSLNLDGTAYIIRNNPNSSMNYFYDKYHIENEANKLHPKKAFMKEDIMVKALDEAGITYKRTEVPFFVELPCNLEEFKKSIAEKGLVEEKYFELSDIFSFIIDTPFDILIKTNQIEGFMKDALNFTTNNRMHFLNNLFIIKNKENL